MRFRVQSSEGLFAGLKLRVQKGNLGPVHWIRVEGPNRLRSGYRVQGSGNHRGKLSTKGHLQHVYGTPRFAQTDQERMVVYCRTASASTAPCANYCTPCQPLLRDFPGWTDQDGGPRNLVGGHGHEDADHRTLGRPTLAPEPAPRTSPPLPASMISCFEVAPSHSFEEHHTPVHHGHTRKHACPLIMRSNSQIT